MQCYIKFMDRVGVLTALSVATICQSATTQAQVIPDSTLGAEASQVSPNVTVAGAPGTHINGGAIRGSNLFHSFSAFSIGELERVYFSNPVGIDNIFSRVTGNTSSDILGTLGVDGGASLYFLNPNGIVFGETAQLDVAGSFHATTAAGFNWGAGRVFSAVNPAAAPQLTVNVSPGLQLGMGQTTLINQGRLFAGGDLTLSGQKLFLAGQLQAGQDLTLQAMNAIAMRDLQADVGSGNDIVLLSQGNLSLNNVRLYTGLTYSSSSFSSSSFSSSYFGSGGDITIYAGKDLSILSSVLSAWSGNSGSSTEANLTASARGNMTIASSFLSINRALSAASAEDNDEFNEVIPFDSSLFFLSGFGPINTSSNRFNLSSGIAISALNLSIDNSYITTSTEVSSAAANISINAQNIAVRDGVIRTGAFSYSSSSSTTEAISPAGEIFLAADQLILNQGRVEAFSTNGSGNIELKIKDQMMMENFSQISTTVVGEGGNITIDIANGSLQGGDAEADSDIIIFNNGEVDVFGEVINFGFADQTARLGNSKNEIVGIEQDDGSGGGLDSSIPYSLNLQTLDDSVEEPELVVRSLCDLGQDSNFIVVGRGGLPKAPQNVLSSAATWEDWLIDAGTAGSTAGGEANREFLSEQPRAATISQPIIEAQGWQRTADGQIVLIANSISANPEPDSDQLTAQDCRQLQQII